MFYYYGRKKSLSKHYPESTYSRIIEPFAGAAAYSLHGNNWKKEVWLIERDPQVAEIWRWLIEDASIVDISNLPELRVGEKSSEFLHIVHAVSKRTFDYKTITVTPVLKANWDVSRRVMITALPKVKHWTIICADYTTAPDLHATWFIDPPYKGAGGTGYRYGSSMIDYDNLARWIVARKGQVIACEGENGDYLPFTHLIQQVGAGGKRSEEKIWHRP